MAEIVWKPKEEKKEEEKRSVKCKVQQVKAELKEVAQTD